MKEESGPRFENRETCGPPERAPLLESREKRGTCMNISSALLNRVSDELAAGIDTERFDQLQARPSGD